MMPLQLDVGRWVTVSAVFMVVAAAMRAALGNPIPYEKKQELIEKYGEWAVKTAIKVCPHDDVECIEREARRLYESRILRR